MYITIFLFVYLFVSSFLCFFLCVFSLQKAFVFVPTVPGIILYSWKVNFTRMTHLWVHSSPYCKAKKLSWILSYTSCGSHFLCYTKVILLSFSWKGFRVQCFTQYFQEKEKKAPEVLPLNKTDKQKKTKQQQRNKQTKMLSVIWTAGKIKDKCHSQKTRRVGKKVRNSC